jgi:DNA excision repair protein ERCC-1
VSHQSFAKIAQADATQIARLPGFGPKKVTRIKDAFERPFRIGTTSALAVPPASASGGPETASIPSERIINEPLDRVWDIELDLNPPSPEGELAQDPGSSAMRAGAAGDRGESSKRAREESPPWDIEDGDALPDKYPRSDSDPDDDEDMDLAPALRAKRRRA